MPEQNQPAPTPAPTPGPPAAAAAPPAQPGQNPPPAAETQPPWGSKENFDPDKAWELIQNLRKEKGDPELKERLQKMEDDAKAQRDRMATALGLKPEETSDSDKLAETVSQLQSQFEQQKVKADRLDAAAANQIPAEFHGWLTATEPAELDAQAKALLPMVQATLAARGQSPLLPGQPVLTTPGAPPFAQNPSQGQGGQFSPEAAAEAEYQAFAARHNRQQR